MPCIDCAVSPWDVQLYAGKPGNYVPLICIAGSSIFPIIARATFIGLEKHAILGNNNFHCIIDSVPAAGNSHFGNNVRLSLSAAVSKDHRSSTALTGGIALEG